MRVGLEQQVAEICAEIARRTGVRLGEGQQRTVLSRLMRRALTLGVGGLDAYFEHFRAHRAEELEALVSLLTTHHTAFFREAAHFRFLEGEGLAGVVAGARARGAKGLRVLSAGCSRGHEVYTLAMVLSRLLARLAPDLGFDVVGLDVDAEAIAAASNGVYRRDEIKVVPAQYLGAHWTRGSGAIAEFIKANDSLRERCEFCVGNVLDPAVLAADERFDLVFCRNLFIYFTAEQVRAAAAALLARLEPAGLFFVGLSESLLGTGLALAPVGPSAYQHAAAVKAAATPAAPTAPLIRVLCVDDSPVILKLLGKMLTPEQGFEIVATAGDGIEAGEALARLRVDVMTLDIHMPKEDGLSYLRRNFSAKHPPVMVLSSVSRDDSELGTNCLQAGASDYVEKPSLATFQERAEEIQEKLRCLARAPAAPGLSGLDAAFAAKKVIDDAGGKLRVIVMAPADAAKVAASLLELTPGQPPTVLLVRAAEAVISTVATDLSARIGRTFDEVSGPLRADALYIGTAAGLEAVLRSCRARTTSVLVYSGGAEASLADLLLFERRNVLAAEGAGVPADDAVPTTSFIDMSNDFLARRGA